MSGSRRTLRWGNDDLKPRSLDAPKTQCAPHEMHIWCPDGHKFTLLLLIEKVKPQVLSLSVSHGANDFLGRWNDGGWWEMEKHEEGNIFFAIRYVSLSPDRHVVWRCDHRIGVPYDILDLFEGTINELRAFYARRTQ